MDIIKHGLLKDEKLLLINQIMIIKIDGGKINGVKD